VIFIHGCFWHGHEGCRYYVVPKTRTEWWLNKISGNIANDNNAEAVLKDAGWNIITLWECELKKSTIENTYEKLLKSFQNPS